VLLVNTSHSIFLLSGTMFTKKIAVNNFDSLVKSRFWTAK